MTNNLPVLFEVFLYVWTTPFWIFINEPVVALMTISLYWNENSLQDIECFFQICVVVRRWTTQRWCINFPYSVLSSCFLPSRLNGYMSPKSQIFLAGSLQAVFLSNMHLDNDGWLYNYYQRPITSPFIFCRVSEWECAQNSVLPLCTAKGHNDVNLFSTWFSPHESDQAQLVQYYSLFFTN